MSKKRKIYAPAGGQYIGGSPFGFGGKYLHYEPINEEDMVTPVEAGSLPITYEEFQYVAFQKILEGKSIIAFGDRGAHFDAIKNGLAFLGYGKNLKDNFFSWDFLTALLNFKRDYKLDETPIIDAATLSAIDIEIDFTKQSDLPIAYYNVDYDFIEKEYPPLAEYVVQETESRISAPILKEPVAPEAFNDELIGVRVYSDTSLYLNLDQEAPEGWVAVKLNEGKGYIPKILTLKSNSLDTVTLLSTTKAYSELRAYLEEEKDAPVLFFNEKRAIGLIRSFTPADQHQFLKDEKLRALLNGKFSTLDMAKALQSFDEIPLDTLFELLLTPYAGSQRVPYILLRNLLLKSEEGKETAAHYRTWFKAEDELTPQMLQHQFTEIRIGAFTKRRKRYNNIKGEEFISDQIFLEGMPDTGIAFTPEEYKALSGLVREDITKGSGFLYEHKKKQAEELYLRGFRRNALRIGLETLDLSEAAIRDQYQGLLKGQIKDIRNTFIKHQDLYIKASRVNPSDMASITGHIFPKANEFNAKLKHNINVIAFRQAVGQDFPIFLDEKINILEYYREIVENENDAEVEEWLKSILDDKLKNIDDTRVNILADDDLIWKLDGLINLTKEKLNPISLPSLNKVVDSKINTEATEETIYTMSMLALGIGLAIVSLGSLSGVSLGMLTLGQLATGGSLVVGAIDTYSMYDEYKKINPAEDTAVDPKYDFTNSSLSFGWIALGLMGIGLDAIAVAKIIRGLGNINKLPPGALAERVKNAVLGLKKIFPSYLEEELIALAHFRKNMYQRLLIEADLQKMGMQKTYALLEDYLFKNRKLILETVGDSKNLSPRQFDFFSDQIKLGFSESKLAQRAGKLREVYQQDKKVVKLLNNLNKQAKKGGNMGKAIYNLLKKLEGLQLNGAGSMVLGMLKRLHKIQGSDEIPEIFADLLWAFSSASKKIKLSKPEILHTIEKFSELIKAKKLPPKLAVQLGHKIKEGQLGSDTIQFILTHYNKLDDATLEIFNNRLMKDGIDGYISRIGQKMDEVTNVADAINKLNKTESAAKVNANKLRTGVGLAENPKGASKVFTYERAAEVLEARSKIAPNSFKLIKEGVALLETAARKITIEIYDQQILNFFSKLKGSDDLPKRYPELVKWLDAEKVAYYNPKALKKYLKDLSVAKRIELMKRMGYQNHHIFAVDTLMKSQAFRRYIDKFKHGLDFNAENSLINSILLLAKKNLSKFDMGVHTNHDEMTIALANFLDARWDKLKDIAELNLTRRGVREISDNMLEREQLRLFDIDIKNIASKIKEDLFNKSVNIKNGEYLNVNNLFGKASDIKNMDISIRAKEVQKYLKALGLDLAIKTK